MNEQEYKERVKQLLTEYEALIQRPNKKTTDTNGIVQRYQYPVLTAAHTPVFWRYDLDPVTNPLLCERMGINSTFNVGAIKLDEPESPPSDLTPSAARSSGPPAGHTSKMTGLPRRRKH